MVWFSNPVPLRSATESRRSFHEPDTQQRFVGQIHKSVLPFPPDVRHAAQVPEADAVPVRVVVDFTLRQGDA
jgi:hypothetical protein